MAENQVFPTVTHEETRKELEQKENANNESLNKNEVEACENEASSTTSINLEKKTVESVDEIITTNTIEQTTIVKTTVQETSSKSNATNKNAIEVSPEQTLETTVFKETKDFTGDNRTVEIEEFLENENKYHVTIDQVVTKETVVTETTVAPIDDVQLTQLDGDNNKQYDFIKTEEKESLSDDDENIDNNPHDSIKTEEKLTLDNDEDLESSTPSTPRSEEDVLDAISKVAPELRQVLDIWNDELSRNKNTENPSDILDKAPESTNLLQGEITYVKEEVIEEEEKHVVKNEGEDFVSDIQGSPSKRIKIEANLNERNDYNVPRAQTLLQPTQSAPSSILSDVVESMFVPGFNRNVVLALDLVFLILLSVESVLAFMTYNIYVFIHMGITLLLFFALQLFLAEAYRAQLEETAKKDD